MTLLSFTEAAERLGTTTRRVVRLVVDGALPVVRDEEGRRRVPSDAVPPQPPSPKT